MAKERAAGNELVASYAQQLAEKEAAEEVKAEETEVKEETTEEVSAE